MFLIVFLVNSNLSWAESMKIGILPVIDTLPLQVGIKEGYFEAENLQVTLVPFTSAMERNTAVHSGQLDGFFGDIMATLLLVKNDVPIRFLTISYQTNPAQRMFGLVLSSSVNRNNLNKPLNVAISKASIIEYLLDHMRELPAVKNMPLKEVEIKRMPIRLQMLLAGKMDGALLPEPLLTLAISKGAKLVVTDQLLEMPLTVLNITNAKRSQKPAFLKAYQKAVNSLNRNPEKYRSLMAKTCRIPKHLAKEFPMYIYPLPRIPTKDEVRQVQNWMLKKRLLDKRIAYQRLIP